MLISLRTGLRPTAEDLPALIDCDWPTFRNWYCNQAQAVYATKDACPMIAFARFAGGFKEVHQGPEGLWALVLDFDHVPEAQVTDLLLCARVLAPEDARQFLVHTTYQNGLFTGERRLRIIYPFDQPVPAGYYVKLWHIACAEFEAHGHMVDPASQGAARFWFLPCTNPSAPEWAQKPWLQEFARIT